MKRVSHPVFAAACLVSLVLGAGAMQVADHFFFDPPLEVIYPAPNKETAKLSEKLLEKVPQKLFASHPHWNYITSYEDYKKSTATAELDRSWRGVLDEEWFIFSEDIVSNTQKQNQMGGIRALVKGVDKISAIVQLAGLSESDVRAYFAIRYFELNENYPDKVDRELMRDSLIMLREGVLKEMKLGKAK